MQILEPLPLDTEADDGDVARVVARDLMETSKGKEEVLIGIESEVLCCNPRYGMRLYQVAGGGELVVGLSLCQQRGRTCLPSIAEVSVMRRWALCQLTR